jgi:inosine-uridine nucleoside N-ribohydrolase
MESAMVRERFRAPILQPVLDFAAVWFEEYPGISFHDPLAAATIFDDQLCRFVRGTVEVELASDRAAGITYWTEGGAESRHEIAVEADQERFFERHLAGIK